MPEYDSTIRYATIPGFPGYMAGSDGTIWSCWSKGRIRKMSDAWKRLKPAKHPKGHLHVILSGGRTRKVHHLVLEAFVGPRPDGMECRHFPDRDPANNRLENLQWGTSSENQADKRVHGTDNRGRRHPMAKLVDADIREIRRLHSLGTPDRVLAARFGVCPTNIHAILVRKSWRHLA